MHFYGKAKYQKLIFSQLVHVFFTYTHRKKFTFFTHTHIDKLTPLHFFGQFFSRRSFLMKEINFPLIASQHE